MNSRPSSLPINNYEDDIGKFDEEETKLSTKIQIGKDTKEIFSKETGEPIDDLDSDSEDMQLPDNFTCSISYAYPLCIKSNELLEKGVILYIYIYIYIYI